MISTPDAAQGIRTRLKERFDTEVEAFYNFRDRERGYIELVAAEGEPRQAQLMSLAVGLVHHDAAPFADIREITEVAAEARSLS